MAKQKVRTNQQIIEALEIELAFIQQELDKPSNLGISLDRERYWISRKYAILKQIEEIDSKEEEDLAEYLEVELKFAEKQMRLASKESKRIINSSQHWIWCMNEITKQIKWSKEACNG